MAKDAGRFKTNIRSWTMAKIGSVIAAALFIGGLIDAITNIVGVVPSIRQYFTMPKAHLSAKTLENGVSILTIRFEDLPEGTGEVPKIRLRVAPEGGLYDLTTQPTATLLAANYNIAIPGTFVSDKPIIKEYAPYIYRPIGTPAVYAEFCLALVGDNIKKKRREVKVVPEFLNYEGNKLNIKVSPSEIVMELFNRGTEEPQFLSPETATSLGEQGCRPSK